MRRSAPGARRARPAAPTEPESPEAAYAAAVKRLAAQPQSRAMLAQKLERAGYTGEAVEAAMARAAARGYLDDQEYARALVRRRSPGRGRAMIARELRARGIEEGAVAQVLGEVDPGAEMERARVLAREIVRLRRPGDRAQLRASVGGRLGRRGFSAGVIGRVLRELSVEAPDAEFDTPLEPD